MGRYRSNRRARPVELEGAVVPGDMAGEMNIEKVVDLDQIDEPLLTAWNVCSKFLIRSAISTAKAVRALQQGHEMQISVNQLP